MPISRVELFSGIVVIGVITFLVWVISGPDARTMISWITALSLSLVGVAVWILTGKRRL